MQTQLNLESKATEKGITKANKIYNAGVHKRSIALLGLAEHGLNK